MKRFSKDSVPAQRSTPFLAGSAIRSSVCRRVVRGRGAEGEGSGVLDVPSARVMAPTIKLEVYEGSVVPMIEGMAEVELETLRSKGAELLSLEDGRVLVYIKEYSAEEEVRVFAPMFLQDIVNVGTSTLTSPSTD
jgi:hypothetical protein